MKDERKAREQLINELAEMRQRMAELETSEAEIKRDEEALRESEREKAIILNSLSELVTYQDRELRIKWANRAAGESVASSPEQLVGRHCYEVWQGRSEPCVGCPVVKALETSQPQQGEMTTPDGRVWLTRGYPVRDKHGDVVGAVRDAGSAARVRKGNSPSVPIATASENISATRRWWRAWNC